MDRVFGGDLNKLGAMRSELKTVQGQKAENENRKILRQRAIDKLNAEIGEMEKGLKQRIKSSIYNAQCHLAGYDVNVDESMERNLEKWMAMGSRDGMGCDCK